MNAPKLIAIGDNVCDKYLSRGKMYPGGQCVNTCAYTVMNGVGTAYLGKFGIDEVADFNQHILDQLGVDRSHCRQYPGDNGYALVTLQGNDRVFLGSNRGGVAKEHPWEFSEADLDYIRSFQVIYTNLNSYVDDDIALLHSTGVPIAYDFSNEWDDAYLAKICPYVDVALLSCAHLSQEARETEMRKAAAHGVTLVLGTCGEAGSYVLSDGQFYYAPAVHAEHVIDTMGAGDSYFAAFLCTLLKAGQTTLLSQGTPAQKEALLRQAMTCGAEFAAQICATEGAFGYGSPILGKTTV